MTITGAALLWFARSRPGRNRRLIGLAARHKPAAGPAVLGRYARRGEATARWAIGNLSLRRQNRGSGPSPTLSERLEYFREHVLRDAGAVIANRYRGNPASRWATLTSIVEPSGAWRMPLRSTFSTARREQFAIRVQESECVTD